MQKCTSAARARSRSRARRRQGGFTLLEMMIASAVLAMSLMWLVEATSRAIAAENRAKLTATATFLARARLVELEDEVAEKGFGVDGCNIKDKAGDFDEKGFKRFKWAVEASKVELPSQDQVQDMVGKALQARQTLAGAGGGSPDKSPMGGMGMGLGGDPSKSGSSGAGGLLGASGGFLQSQFTLIKQVLEQGICRVKVTVSWEDGAQTRNIEFYEYLTDPRQVDLAIQMPMGMPGMPGMPGAPGTGGTGGSSTGGTGGTGTGGMSQQPSAFPANR